MNTPNEALRATLHERLAGRHAELQTMVREARAAAAERPSAQGAPQVEDIGEAGEQRHRGGVEHAEMQRHLEEIVDIEAAQQRMADGSYGECVDCGVEIAPERLLAQPVASRCVACQTAYEKAHPAVPRFS